MLSAVLLFGRLLRLRPKSKTGSWGFVKHCERFLWSRRGTNLNQQFASFGISVYAGPQQCIYFFARLIAVEILARERVRASRHFGATLEAPKRRSKANTSEARLKRSERSSRPKKQGSIAEKAKNFKTF